MEGALSLRGGALESEGTEPNSTKTAQLSSDVTCSLGRGVKSPGPLGANSGGVLWDC